MCDTLWFAKGYDDDNEERKKRINMICIETEKEKKRDTL